MASQSFSGTLHFLSILEQVCKNEGVLELSKNLPEWTNALNDCLSLCKRVARQVETALFLGQEDWERFMDVICLESKGPEMFSEALTVLKMSLESEAVFSSAYNSREFSGCLVTLKQLAEKIEDDHRSGIQLGNTLWKELRQIVQQNTFVLPDVRPISQPERNPAIPTYKEKLLTMPLEEKRKLYACKSNFQTLSFIPSWQEIATRDDSLFRELIWVEDPLYPVRRDLNEKISLFMGDITTLEIDAIVNSANRALTVRGGVDRAIHRAAGPALAKECQGIKGIETGMAKITGGYLLPAKYVIQAVGPIGKNAEKLQSCYKQSLKLLLDNGLRTIAFSCISTGAYNYPNEHAATVALKTVREFLQVEDNSQKVDRIIFCVLLPVDNSIYRERLPVYFPVQ